MFGGIDHIEAVAQYANGRDMVMERSMMCCSVDAQGEPADDEQAWSREIADELLRDLSAIFRCFSGTDDGEDLLRVEVG